METTDLQSLRGRLLENMQNLGARLDHETGTVLMHKNYHDMDLKLREIETILEMGTPVVPLKNLAAET
ncbi:MAG: hypothetical protein A3C85_02815 [Candidatus Doudnabacteria bacterium RIFCSPHIGHO2_02_FULL_48_21]|uniref:Uncharacterized protein n=1 Tax=Candidatus Doudnabacteria bacterium RIFCSPLOWO2_02_FULL_48_13 TaxID=1817845 RepID=A0A1F5Q9I9_9BACT|nr:MAG: hypothetical protein A3K05_03430 [Candidatus Doudnabacteria bacterium RIFCSPHIGHO2_01_48_18]OGE79507.1 MAG: hypothetical protein A2668_00200 [Candidatus Doudnabacteria bacterium RIFCSPHIGHO2_01_FULL_48_180]OGE91340.1 MAG: hypothetical protein A3F44_03475 [Candidatus Doudnabacteria bacterium RIFCSPHIGHO2_12_FULL_47_25]OGE92885.1 MAG: hypothetical protein A3C85_02815 [Candidatus Doudnabacteria bacterium RIFCSPHIGHO2_02_FULL_48_21]OGE98879.1 MAG: hypothetical protein A3J05_03260 [Candidatu